MAAGLIAQQGSAADVETLTIGSSNTWNATPISSGVKTAISFTSGYGEFKLISSSITKSDYKGFKVEFSDLVNLAGGGVHLKIGKSVMVDDKDEGVYKYFNFADATDNVVTGQFDSDLDEEIATFNVQCTLAGESVTITKFILIKSDGTEVEAESLGGVSWGCETKVSVTGISFTGQWGYEKILAADGSALTYDPVAEKDIVYTYNIELAEPAENTLCFEVDKDKGDGSDTGMKWNNLAKGESSITFEVSAATCAAAVTNIYIKADAASGYPFTVNFKSVTRTKKDNSIPTDLNKYDILKGSSILKSDLEQFDATDKVVFTYSYAWDDATVNFNGWGMGGIRSAADVNTNIIDINGTSEPGTYTYVTTVGDLLAICGHHAAEEGEGKDNTEWDGLYWIMWSNTNGSVTCVTTKISVEVYTSKEISAAVKNVSSSTSVVSTEYYSLTGAMSATPVRGINIVKQTLSDGSTRYAKQIVK